MGKSERVLPGSCSGDCHPTLVLGAPNAELLWFLLLRSTCFLPLLARISLWTDFCTPPRAQDVPCAILERFGASSNRWWVRCVWASLHRSAPAPFYSLLWVWNLPRIHSENDTQTFMLKYIYELLLPPDSRFYFKSGSTSKAFAGFPWRSCGYESGFPVQGTWVWSLVKELDPTGCK